MSITTQPADLAAMPAEGMEPEATDEEDAEPLPRVVRFVLNAPGEAGLEAAVIATGFIADDEADAIHNIAHGYRLRLIVGRTLDELTPMVTSALISEFGLAQEDAEGVAENMTLLVGETPEAPGEPSEPDAPAEPKPSSATRTRTVTTTISR